MASRFACARILQSLLSYAKLPVQRQARYLSVVNTHYQRYFTKDHEWIDVTDNVGTVGITDYAQQQLGEIVYVELPELDTECEIKELVAAVESVKAVSEIMTPVTGKIVEVNDVLIESPGLLNNSPEDFGWMFKVAMTDKTELEDLVDLDKYEQFIKETEE